MVAVAVYHTCQQAGMFLVDARQTVFLYYKNAEAVSGIEHFGSHRAVSYTHLDVYKRQPQSMTSPAPNCLPPVR